MSSDPPKAIYLQWNSDELSPDTGVTWCTDQINEDDVQYISLAEAIILVEKSLLGSAVANKFMEGAGEPGGFTGIAQYVKEYMKDE